MHYKNGREAKNGDKVVLIPSYGPPQIGVLYDATQGNDSCNGKLAPISSSNPMPNLAERLHLDDVLAALPASVPDSSKPVVAPDAPPPGNDGTPTVPPAPATAA